MDEYWHSTYRINKRNQTRYYTGYRWELRTKNKRFILKDCLNFLWKSVRMRLNLKTFFSDLCCLQHSFRHVVCAQRYEGRLLRWSNLECNILENSILKGFGDSHKCVTQSPASHWWLVEIQSRDLKGWIWIIMNSSALPPVLIPLFRRRKGVLRFKSSTV